MPVGRILIVEDDPQACLVLCQVLEEDGHECLSVATDQEAYGAIARLKALRGLIVDINLGSGTTGFDVARFARQAVPDLPVLYISGQISADSFRAFGVPGSAFLDKPFSTELLLATLRKVLPQQPA